MRRLCVQFLGDVVDAGGEGLEGVEVDADVLAWLKSKEQGYQTRINAIVREAATSRTKSGNVWLPPAKRAFTTF